MNVSRSFCDRSHRNPLVERGLQLHLNARLARDACKWFMINLVVLAVLLLDISNKCRYTTSFAYNIEYAFAAIVAVGVAVNGLRFIRYRFQTAALEGTKEQKDLLTFEDNDGSFIIKSPNPCKTVTENAAAALEQQSFNMTLASFHSSFNETCELLGSPLQHRQQHSSMYLNQSNAMNRSNDSCNNSFMSPYLNREREDIITDEQSLRRYLRVAAQRDAAFNETQELNQSHLHETGNSFWTFCNKAANSLKTSLYQLAPSNVPTSAGTPRSKEEGGLNINMNKSTLMMSDISSEKMSQYVAKLRRWIAITILHRLTKEMEQIDASFKNRGFVDMQVGCIGLERLKKTIENHQFVNQFVPTLPMIVPFLEMSSNQEYLVQRIKDLAKGHCIAEYSWNSGASYHGLKWDEHLPTDSAIIFHLFCVYLDSQLIPQPHGGGRPFFSNYVVTGVNEKSVKETIANIQNKARCAILCTDPLKPKFNFISDKEVHSSPYDRNNLFYVIIQFLMHMRTHNSGLLEGVNLGRSGINILCVIED